jgi:hypothetical protein
VCAAISGTHAYGDGSIHFGLSSLVNNFNPASILMGDVGPIFIG